MDFGQTHLGGLISNSQQDEKAKHYVVGSRIKMGCELMKNLYGKSWHVKLVENSYGQVIVTSQASVIYDSVKANHPFVKLLQEYVKKMDVVGDGSKLFVLLVSELLSEMLIGVNKGMKPALLSGMLREMYKEIDGMAGSLMIEHEIDFEDVESIKKVLRGVVKDEHLERIVSEGVRCTKGFESEDIRVCKVGCGSMEDSYVVEGMVFNRAPEGEVKSVKNGRTSIYNCGLEISRTELKGTVLLKTADELLAFSKDENIRTREMVESLSADVIVCSGKVDKIYLDFLNKCEKLVFKVSSKHDLRRIREVMGGHISSSLCTQAEDFMGEIDEVVVFSEGKEKYTKFVSKSKRKYTLVLKSSVKAVLDEHERIVQKALTVLSKNVNNGKIWLVEGAGRFERRMSMKMMERSGSESGSRGFVYKCVGNALGRYKQYDEEIYDVYNAKVKALKYAVEFIAMFFETSDYLIGKPEAMSISARENQNWDEDH
ncbi:subunit theta of T-complex protein 1 [Ordospora colligata]|uniref:Subunit theta of T-complex protein 1 n=1 Tax=Ordospora colligata OC4 TaxID=1354746 RepID=A0A0B2UFU2_9MICR|nr:subunit theta of T-complex protein 1 [Ordospora colligata OC4]KHN69951.1 subunit theta of T-complex protein 1 [Ordospora colligata OC4]TBU16121.1 subunit theta of T-complex protein 1 [Ordospora colligata]TBU16334.1 subunit theta of T-complex protein 1 [Ordospora colligata]TBU19038.1 subunit theta of T-complex protein 1 [Ordospora colligata]